MGEDITSMFIGKNPSYPAGDTYPICIGWTSSWFMDDYDISYGIDMRPIDGTDNQVSIILLGPGYDFLSYTISCNPRYIHRRAQPLQSGI